jgi:uncharacterized protein (DUF2267 family)
MSNDTLNNYYTIIQQAGKLRTPEHAQRWSEATLRTLALNLSRGAKKELSQALPEELRRQLERQFWLLHFPDKSLSQMEFQRMVARRAGNTDAQFARYPVQATFQGLKSLVGANVSNQVADGLSPDVRELWQNA